MRSKKGIVFIVIGAALILSALSLFLLNQHEDAAAGREAEKLLGELQASMELTESPAPVAEAEGEKTPAPEASPEPEPEELPPELPVTTVGSYDYVGYISIPAIGVELPVMADWDYERLGKSPCRQFGSSRTDDLVIAAHNFESHFGYLSKLKPGDTACFTDLDRIENLYELVKVEVLAPDAVDTVENSGHDLVLYTCTYGGANRVAAFFDRVAGE